MNRFADLDGNRLIIHHHRLLALAAQMHFNSALAAVVKRVVVKVVRHKVATDDAIDIIQYIQVKRGSYALVIVVRIALR